MNYAKLDGNVVINIEVADEEWVNKQPNKASYVAYTSENSACIGGDYIDGYFYPIKPFDSWTRDGKGQWQAPKPYPQDNKRYIWDETTLAWLEQTVIL